MYKKILILSTPDINQASGIMAYDLCLGIRKYTKCDIMVYATNHDDAISYSNKLLYYKKKVLGKIKSKLFLQRVRTDPNYYFFDLNQRRKLINQKRLRKHMKGVDLVIAYFANNFFTPSDLHDIQNIYNVPLVLIMPDQIHITGGCHFSWDCNGFKKYCEDCPAIIKDRFKGIAHENLIHNYRLYKDMDIKLIALSGQDYQKAVQSTLFKDKSVAHIFGGIDRSTFYKMTNKEELRNDYGIDNEEITILYGATNIAEERKGFKYFIETLKHYKDSDFYKDILVLLIGKVSAIDEITALGFRVLNLGYINDYNRLSEVINITDVFCVTSVQDSGPMMINQSICCGTPVLSFAVGVAPDLIQDGKTGFLANCRDSYSLAKSLGVISNMSSKEREMMSSECISLAEKILDRNIIAKDVLDFALGRS